MTFSIEPTNSLSNIGYIIGGLLLIKEGYKIYGLLLVIVGISTLIYHSTFTRIGQLLDLGSIYIILSYLILKLFIKISEKYSLIISISICIIITTLNVAVIETGYFSRNIVLLLSIIFIILLIKAKLKTSKFLYLLPFMLGFTFWVLDSHVLCFGYSGFINGHSLWHLITAYGF